MTKPFIVEDRTKAPSKEEVITQLANIIFTDCEKGGIFYGLDTNDVAVAMFAAAESMMWFINKAGTNSKKMAQIRKDAAKIVAKRTDMFDKSGITKLIEKIKDKRYLETAISGKEYSKKDADIHTDHCCLKHGCKYGDRKCTVVSGEKKQIGPCEICGRETDKDEY